MKGGGALFAVIHEETNARGPRRCVALRDIAAGTCISFEEPLAVAPPGMFEQIQEPAPEEIALDEWLLTFVLLGQGKRRAWSKHYVQNAVPKLEAKAPIEWLSKRFACSESDVLAVFRAVCNNAFSLDTTTLKVKYGCAIYEKGSFFNHSWLVRLVHQGV
jgi:hypothetical protein